MQETYSRLHSHNVRGRFHRTTGNIRCWIRHCFRVFSTLDDLSAKVNARSIVKIVQKESSQIPHSDRSVRVSIGDRFRLPSRIYLHERSVSDLVEVRPPSLFKLNIYI